MAEEATQTTPTNAEPPETKAQEADAPQTTAPAPASETANAPEANAQAITATEAVKAPDATAQEATKAPNAEAPEAAKAQEPKVVYKVVQTGPTVTPEMVKRIAAKYDTPLQAIVRPEVVMGVPRYFLDRWVPVLGPSPATLVNTLRQLTYHAPKEPVVRSGEALAAEAAMSRRHMYKCLKSPWVRVFVQVQSGTKIKREGRTTRHPNRYTVRHEDPLTPADAQHLYTQLRQFADNPIEAMRRALEKTPRQLWAESPLTPPQTRFAKPKAIFAADVVRRAYPRWQPANEDERIIYDVLTDLLHKHVTLVRQDGRVSKVIVPQYFRKHWWPLLGHDLAWIYLWLRGRTYENEQQGILRLNCWVPSLNTLLEVIGRPREWWRRHIDHAKAGGNGWTISEFFVQTQTQKGRNPKYPQRVARCFTVNVSIPVAPENRDYYSDLTLYWPAPPEPAEEETAPAKPQTQPSGDSSPAPAEAPPVTPVTAATDPTPAETSAETEEAPPLAPVFAFMEEPSPEAIRQAAAFRIPQSPGPDYEERLRKALASVRGRSKPFWEDGNGANDKTEEQPSYEDTTSHMRAQSEEGVPHLDTLNEGISATSVHNELPPSDTNVHKALPHPRTGSKNLEKALPENHSYPRSTSHRGDPPTPDGNEPITKNAAAEKEKINPEKVNLSALLNRALRQDPQRRLYQIAPLRVWLEQGPDSPVFPHTPAWRDAYSGRIPLSDMVALVLAVRADATLHHQARHLSWLTGQYILRHGQPPVHNWPAFRQLAQMPIGEWPTEGHRLWLTLCTHTYKNMPWYLDEIFREAVLDGVIEHPGRQYTLTHRRWNEYEYEEEKKDEPYDGLDERPGESLYSAYAVWQVALGHIRMEIGEEPYRKWVVGCEPVYYKKDTKELFVRARDKETAEVLSTRFIGVIQEMVQGAAQGEVTVRFVVGKFLPEASPDAADNAEQGDKPDADTPPMGTPSGPDSS